MKLEELQYILSFETKLDVDAYDSYCRTNIAVNLKMEELDNFKYKDAEIECMQPTGLNKMMVLLNVKINDEEPEPQKDEEVEMSLTIEYKNNANGKTYIRFDAEEHQERISLFCHDDDSGAGDITISLEELNKNYTEIKRYMED